MFDEIQFVFEFKAFSQLLYATPRPKKAPPYSGHIRRLKMNRLKTAPSEIPTPGKNFGE